MIRLSSISGNQRTIASRKLSSLVGHYLNDVLDNFLLSGGQMKSEKFG